MPELGMILRYVAVTAVSLLLLILTTRAIGQAPLLRFSGNVPLPGWQAVTDSQFRFTLDLPDAWQTIDLPYNPAASKTPPIPALADSFAALVADSELLFLGIGAETAVAPPFTLVSHSQRLNQLTAEQYVAYAQQQLPANITVSSAEVIVNDLGVTKGELTFDLQETTATWRCLHQFVAGPGAVYLLTSCAPANQFSHFATDFTTILSSFQPLES
ncbi:MAG: hypothetical protein R3D55_24830 [Chloroflexota bacterium]